MGQPWPDRTADATAWHSGDHGAAMSRPHHRQSPQSADRTKPDRARLHRRGPKPGLAGRYHLRPTAEDWLYLAAVMDLFSRKIVGWAMPDHMRVELVSSALTMALRQQRPDAGLVHHSDRGVQYASHEYRAALTAAGLTHRLLRQCPDGEVLPHPQDRARSSSSVPDPCRSPARHLRLHRGLLQSNQALFRHRIYPSDRDGAKSRLNPSAFSGEDQSAKRGQSDALSRLKTALSGATNGENRSIVADGC